MLNAVIRLSRTPYAPQPHASFITIVVSRFDFPIFGPDAIHRRRRITSYNIQCNILII